MRWVRKSHPILLLLAISVAPVDARPPIEPLELAAATPYLVIFEEAPLAKYRGGLAGLEPTSPLVSGDARLDADGAAAKRYRAYLAGRKAAHLEALADLLGRPVAPLHSYEAVVHGLSLLLAESEAARVATLPGVRHVVRDRALEPATDAGPTWIGAPGVWNGSDTAGQGATRGEGIIVGAIDSGVNMDHPAFTDPGGDGHDHVNPLGPGVFTGWCDPANIPPGGNPGPWICNDKLVGAWDFTDGYCTATGLCTEDDGPEDDHSHGSLTAGTAVGNVTPAWSLSGVAPHAALIAYDACYTVPPFGGKCPLVNLVAAVDQAVIDGVDVITFSIVGGLDPWSADDIDSYFLGAVEAGVLVSSAAGNDGPTPGLVLHRGPWVMNTGATTHDRVAVANELTDFSGGTSPPANLLGESRTGGYGPAPVVHAEDFPVVPNAARCGDWNDAFPPGTWSQGEIVVCDQGDIPVAIKCFNVEQGGAGGCVIANVNPGVESEPDAHVVPATHVMSVEGDALRSWLGSGGGHMARITPSVQVLDPASADVVADFSSRGPNESFDVLKPELAAPGVAIFAPAKDDFVGFWAGQPAVPGLVVPEYGHFQGTSLATPHASGAAALLRALFPSLTPAEIRSLLMLTAQSDGVATSSGGPPADAFDIGAGRIELGRAARAGLVLDETAVAYEAADPALGGSPRTLNLPSLMHSSCGSGCSWTRTVRNIWSSAVTWSLEGDAPAQFEITALPNRLTLNPGESAEVLIQVSFLVTPPEEDWFMGALGLTPSDPDLVATRLPVAVRRGTTIFADGFESGDASHWSDTVP